jgi:molybdate/tungstate transport system ATP-binding protein
MNVMAELDNVTKMYGKITALNDVSLKIPRGEVFTLIGPNGSGKTTLLKILACIEKPTKGKVYFDRQLVEERNMPKLRLKSTMVFQKTVLFNATAYENIAYGLKLRGFSKEEINERIRHVLKLVKLEDCEKRPAKKLSGGEQQRVSLARALALRTELLLLDEPMANLDQRNASIIEAAISQIKQETSTTIILATHDMFQVETLSEKVALINNGKMIHVGKTREILEHSRKLANFARIENIFSGVSCVTKDGTSRINVGDNVQIEASTRRSGKISVFVMPEDIILSKIKFASSARNVFEGRIVEISDLGPTVRLRIDAGKQFVVQITKHSFIEMQLNLSSKVFVTFKASSVHTID